MSESENKRPIRHRRKQAHLFPDSFFLVLLILFLQLGLIKYLYYIGIDRNIDLNALLSVPYSTKQRIEIEICCSQKSFEACDSQNGSLEVGAKTRDPGC